MEKEIESPCIKVCMPDSTGVCFGCKRTREEIGDWMKYTNKQKQEVIDKLSTRENAEEMRGFSF